jgi:hypothetical protein
MARGSGKKKGSKKTSKRGAKDKGVRIKPGRSKPKEKEVPREEISALSAFILSFGLLSLIIAPVLGLLLYFFFTVESITAFFQEPEWAFLGGMGIGVGAAFAGGLVFTYYAVEPR